jgi:hypothetical protein
MRNHNYLNFLNIFQILISVTILFSLNFISCAGSPDFVDKPIGNNIDITMKNADLYPDLELLFIYEDTLYTLFSNSKVYPIPMTQIEQISVSGYSDRSWLGAILGLQVVPSILLGVVGSSVDKGAWVLTGIMLIPAGIEAALFESSTPDAPLFKSPIEEKVPEFKKYARYPIEMSRDNINALEKFYGLINRIIITKKQE